MKPEAIRYLVIQPNGDVFIKVGALTAKAIAEVVGKQWGVAIVPSVAQAFFSTSKDPAQTNRLASAWLGDTVYGAVLVTGPESDLTGVPTSAEFDLAGTIMRHQEE